MKFSRAYFILVLFLAGIAFYPPYFIKAFELRIYNIFMRFSSPNAPDPRIIIVGIDQKSLDQYGRWPWPRDLMGRLVVKMARFGVRVTAFDVIFSTKAGRELTTFADMVDTRIVREGISEKFPSFYNDFSKWKNDLNKDQAFAEGISFAGNVATGFHFHGNEDAEYIKTVDEGKRKLVRPFRLKMVERSEDSQDAHIQFLVRGVEPNIPIIQKAGSSSGFLNITPDEDGVIRSHPLLIEYKGDIYPSLALAAVRLYAGDIDTFVSFNENVLSGIYIGDGFFETDLHGRYLLKYLGPDGTFPIISAADILNEPLTNEKFKERLAGKIAFVGATATQIFDLRVSPFGFTAGVEIHANAAAGILNGIAITQLYYQPILNAFITLMIGLLLAIILQRVRVILGLCFAAALFLGMIFFNYWMFEAYMLWLNTVMPGVGIALCFTSITVHQFLLEQRSKRFIKGAFSRYLSPKVINQIIENPKLLSLGGEKREMTAFFSDVAGFTTISEKLDPPGLVNLLNEYLTEMTDIIHEFHGTVDKFEGDAIIAFWGAPLHVKNHAELCVRASIKMQKTLTEMRAKWRKEGREELFVRMGVNTGQMVVGNMGSKDRMDYTIMGDSVNLAARLEGANKYYGSDILVSEFTLEYIKNDILVMELDRVRVQGKKDAITLYSVIDEMEKANDDQKERVKKFEQALTVFRSRKANEAEKLFQENADIFGPTVTDLYLKRIRRLREMPDELDWDAVYDLAK
ncbi:Adenylate cyclase [hydrothermal vent metagenome]|uniref:Adenylate cyclase n=1 Tax=hydrothermal vent metagenome TaxID=652676 RepID=A0A3B1BF99_9ZZZZ